MKSLDSQKENKLPSHNKKMMAGPQSAWRGWIGSTDGGAMGSRTAPQADEGVMVHRAHDGGPLGMRSGRGGQCWGVLCGRDGDGFGQGMDFDRAWIWTGRLGWAD